MLRQPDLPLRIAQALRTQDFLICREAFDPHIIAELRAELLAWQAQGRLESAGIGRGGQHQVATAVRSDLRAWLTGESLLQQKWLEVMRNIQETLNQHLLLGLVEYEAHYAYYSVGSFYRRHLDSFRGNNPRRVSTVLYLNDDWKMSDGGALTLYPPHGDTVTVLPEGGTLVVFLSELIPHEVSESTRERYSIAGWMRQREIAVAR